jgi:hypothetical protein
MFFGHLLHLCDLRKLLVGLGLVGAAQCRKHPGLRPSLRHKVLHCTALHCTALHCTALSACGRRSNGPLTNCPPSSDRSGAFSSLLETGMTRAGIWGGWLPESTEPQGAQTSQPARLSPARRRVAAGQGAQISRGNQLYTGWRWQTGGRGSADEGGATRPRHYGLFQY